MGRIITVSVCLAWLCPTWAAKAEETRWITFKTTHDGWGRIENQIDRASIRQEGPYRIFWTRVWIDSKKQPMVFTQDETLVFLSEKFAVDCVHHRFGPRFIDSNNALEKKHSARLETMHWQKLEAVPAVGRAVCGDR